MENSTKNLALHLLSIFALCFRAVPLKNPRAGKTPPLKLDPPAPGFFKILDPPAPRFAKSIGPPHPQIHLCPSDPQLQDFYGYLALRQCYFRDF